ncbi:MAG: hypothetical protein U9R58_05375 [Chloroflexota bacterium]|nr:hypothetical protein [Chloroflexota bacterium]
MLYLLVGVVFVLILYLAVSFQVPPVRNLREWWRSFGCILLKWGRFVLVREGRCEPALDLIKDRPQNIAIVDLASALVLEKRLWSALPESFDDGIDHRELQPPLVRVAGPGIVFFERGERIHSAVSLQKQFRMINEVTATTADGIEVKANIYMLFSITLPPDVIHVVVSGENRQLVYFVNIDPATREIKNILDVLDDAEKEDIWNWIVEMDKDEDEEEDVDEDEDENPGDSRLVTVVQGEERPRYRIDNERIFRAVYAQMQNDNQNGEVRDWTDIAVLAAVEVFRNLISRWTFDSFYDKDNQEVFPILDRLMPEFRARVRNQGVVEYQLIRRRDRRSPQIGDRVDRENYLIWEPNERLGAKNLQDCGIRVVTAGFTGFIPVQESVSEQQLESWEARWQEQADVVRSNYDREVIRIRTRAREDAQGELIQSLSELFDSTDLTEEALAVRFFQSMESLASDPATRRILSLYTMRSLRDIGDRLQVPSDERLLGLWEELEAGGTGQDHA